MNYIVCLTRGYENLSQYDVLIKRNQAIAEHINKDLKTVLVIFHEGNISDDQMNHITAQSSGQTLSFINISSVWIGGYEGMCRFYTYDVWSYFKEDDLILRIDEDCHVTSCDKDPFSLIGDKDYLRSVYWAESHSETNATLPGFIEKLTGSNRVKFYNGKFPYTNVGLARIKFFKDLQPLIKKIAYDPMQLANRWGDLPVIGSILNIYAVGKVGAIEGLSYKHYSHNVTINCDANG